MNITTLERVLPFLLKAKITPWVWGFHGKGKSETIENYYKSKDWLVFNFRLNTQADVGDFLGLQDFIVDPKTGKKVATAFFKPDWLHQAMEFCVANPDKRACIFIDEINRAARHDLIGPVFQMSLDRKLHTYEFPDNLDVICASNPNTGDYAVLSLDDKALLSRFCHIYFNPDKKEFVNYAKKTKADADVLEFLKEQPDFLEEKDLERFSVSDYAKPDRRKWLRGVSKLKQLGLKKEDYHEVFAGLVGIEAAVAFEKYLQRPDKPITVEDILNNYDSIQNTVINYAGNENRNDILNTACAKVIEFYQANPEFTEDQGKNTIKFVIDLPNELMFNVMHGIYNKRKFHDFCEKHYDVLLKPIEARLEAIRQVVDPTKD